MFPKLLNFIPQCVSSTANSARMMGHLVIGVAGDIAVDQAKKLTAKQIEKNKQAQKMVQGLRASDPATRYLTLQSGFSCANSASVLKS